MKTLILTLLLSFCLISCTKAEDSLKSNIDSSKTEVLWDLVWEDNFETDGLPDKSVWSYEEGYIRNKEAQYYTKER
jgi:hypothetical protein